MTFTDGIKWNPFARVLKYEPDTVREIAAYLDSHRLRPADRFGLEPSGPELRMLEQLHGVRPDELTEARGNILVNQGLARITALIVGGGGNPFNNTYAYTGVGDRNGDTGTAPAATDTALTATTNRRYQGADISNPTASGAVITNNTTFQSGDANFAWNEWCWGIGNAAPTAGTTIPAGVMLNHKVQALGTKASGAIWTLQATVTLS